MKRWDIYIYAFSNKLRWAILVYVFKKWSVKRNINRVKPKT